MTEVLEERKNWHSKKTVLGFSLGPLVDQMSHQAFQSLIFVFYFSVMGVNVANLAWSFLIFAIWDSINDPLMGPISDRTKSKFGRRGFWVLISLIPFALVNLFLFTPPGTPGSGQTITTIYMIVIIMLYDLFYTMFSTQQLALFAEMFTTEDERAEAGKVKNILTIVGLFLGFVLPTILIKQMAPDLDMTAQEIAPMYLTTGIVLAILVIVIGILFFKLGIKERPTEIIKPAEMPSVWESLKITLKNKSFILFIIANLFNWVVFKNLTTVISLYGQFVLGFEEGDFGLTLLLLIALLTAAFVFPLVQKLGLKVGMRNSFIITEIFWICALIPFAFFDGVGSQTAAFIMMAPMGVGLAGAMYHTDIIIGSIIDEDEIKTGKRREGSYYGINALFNRYSTILVFVAIAIVLTGYGWSDFLLTPSFTDITNFKTGLKVLFVGVNIGAILIVILFLKLFPLHGDKLKEVNDKIKEIRSTQAIE